MSYDVLICTDPNRERSLYGALVSIATQSIKPRAVILSLVELQTAEAKLAAKLLQSLGVIVVCDAHAAELTHMNERLNLMLQMSESDYVMTIDDDNVLKSDTAERWLYAVSIHETVGACTGIQVMCNSEPLPEGYTPQSYEIETRPRNLYNRLINGWQSDKSQFVRCHDNEYRFAEIFYNAYMIRRFALDEVNGWDDINLKSVGGEVDLALRLREKYFSIMIWTDEYYHLRAPVDRPCNLSETIAAERYLDERYGS